MSSGKPDMFFRRREGGRDFGNRFDTTQGRDQGNTIVTFIPREDHPMYLKVAPPTPPKEAA